MSGPGHLLYRLFPGQQLPLIMGILNVTPDSFSDGNQFVERGKAVAQAFRMIEEGADIIDVGGESTRPGSLGVDAAIEMDRVIPVIEEIRRNSNFPISVDTSKATVADEAIKAGADIVNDVYALQHDPLMAATLARHPDTGVILMHMQGTPADMQNRPVYSDVILEISEFFRHRIDFCQRNGISSSRLFLDPGIGFGKLLNHNLVLLANHSSFHGLGLPLMIGASRKSFIDQIYPSSATERLAGSLAAVADIIDNSVAIIRVHDVKQHKQFVKVLRAIRSSRSA